VDRAEKREFVTELNDVFKASGSVVVAHYAGITVAQMNDLRSKMRAAGGTVKVAKNRLAKIALQGTESEKIADLVQGADADRLFANDPVERLRRSPLISPRPTTSWSFSAARWATTLDADGVKALATLPSLDELRAKLVGHDQTPATRDRQVVNAPAPACPRVRSLRQEGRSGVRPFAVNQTQTRSNLEQGSRKMADLAKIVDDLSALTVLEAAELSKLLEEKWGVSAAAPVAVAAAGGWRCCRLLPKRRPNST
jgi:large subunit ribosomal protein L10